MKFFRKHQKTLTAVLAAVLAILMLLPMLANIIGGAMAVTTEQLQSQINDLKNKSGELAQQKKDLSAQLASIQKDKTQAMNQKDLVEQEIEVIRQEIAYSDAMLTQYDGLIGQKEEELAAAQEKEAIQFDLFCERVRAMEESGTVSYFSILFNAADFSDLLDRVTFVNEVMEYDNAVMDLLARTREQVAAAKADLEAGRAEQQAVRDAQADQKSQLDEKLAQAQDLVSQISAKEDEVEKAKRELEAAAASMDKQLAAKQKELAAKIAAGKITINAGTGYLWPLPGYDTIFSLFGNRINPVTHKPQHHSGIDIPAPRGTPILAARGGVVLRSARESSYGNFVVISHGGNNESTLYAHMNSRAVKEGDVVSQGQVIGYVGTTGRSTGYHLHFEVRINNVRTDPINYYPGMTLYVSSSGSGKKTLLEH